MKIHLNNIKEYVWTEETSKAIFGDERLWKIASVSTKSLSEMYIDEVALPEWLDKYFPKGIKKGMLERKLRRETNNPDFHIDIDVLTPAIEKII